MKKYVLVLSLAASLFLFSLSYCFASDRIPPNTYSVQISACLKEASADGDVSRLKNKGYHPYIFEATDSKNRAWYIVRIGDYPSLKEAETAARAYEKEERADAVVTRSNSSRVLRHPRPRPAKVALNELKPEAPPVNESRAESGANKVSDANAAGITKKEPVDQSSQTGSVEKAAPPEAPAQVAADEAPAATLQKNTVEESPEGEKKAPPAAVKPGSESPSIKQLEERLNTIEKELNQMREQAEARKKLEITSKEKEEKEKEVLSAAGRQYVLLGKGTLGVEYDFSYAYYSYDVLTQATRIEHNSNHNLTNAAFIEYALFNNLTFNTNLPFVYKYDQSGTPNSKSVTDLGDVSVGVQWQPVKSGGAFPAAILQGTFTFPTGRSPYKINPNDELSTGNGYYSADAGLTLSHTVDPVVAFGSLDYSHNFNISSLDQQYSGGRVLTKVEPGDVVTLGLGIGYALSYKTSLNISYQYGYHFRSRYSWENAGKTEAAAYATSILSIGTGWRISPGQSVYLKVGVGLTNDDPDFIVSFRLPFQFSL